MSVYKPQGSPYYHYDIQLDGDRIRGSTKRRKRREAEAVAEAEKEKLKQRQAAESAATTSLVIADVAGRYWAEIGQHHAGSKDTWRDLQRLVTYFKPETALTEISDNEVTQLVAWRRGHRVERKRKKPREDAAPAALIRNATVNRSTTEVLKKLFTRAKTWGAKFPREPKWKEHWLDEPQERVRELVGDEKNMLDEATREDYEPFFAFVHASGLRMRECLLRWKPDVDWAARQIRKEGKGGKLVTAPITPTVRSILWPLRGHHDEFVFTYVAQRTRPATATQGATIRGQRYPLTYNGVKTAWRRLRAKAGVEGFRFHDFRHDVGTKLLRQTGNLKLVQRALNHADLKTTAKYAHVLDEEVAEAQEARTNPRKNPRSVRRKVG